MRVAIIGADADGQVAAGYWHSKGAQVAMLSAPPKSGYDLVVRPPEMKPDELKAKTPVTTAVREFFQQCPAQIIGVTGTQGKDEVAELIARMIGEAGRRVWSGGPVGRSPLKFLAKVRASDVVVLDLECTQLMDLDVSPRVSVCLRLLPEEAKAGVGAREYVAALGNLFWHQESGDVAVYDPTNDFSTQIALLSRGRKVPFLERPGAYVADRRVIKIAGIEICEVGTAELGPGNAAEMICAAVTAAWEMLGEKPEPMRRAIAKFKERKADEGV